MNVYVGQVINIKTLESTERMIVDPDDASLPRGIPVIYTSTYGGEFSPKGKAGLFAIPGPRSRILFVKASDNNYYYLSTIHAYPPGPLIDTGEGTEVVTWKESGQLFPGIFNLSADPQAVVFADPVGNFLQFTHKADKNGIFTNVTLESRDGKRLLLADSPGGDGIYLATPKGDGLTIANEFRDGYSAGQLTSPCEVRLKSETGPVRLESTFEGISISCPQGKDINIDSGGAGFQTLFPNLNIASPPSVDLATMGPLFQSYGNSRIGSQVRDVIISSGETHRTIYSYIREAWNPIIFRSRVMIRAYGPSHVGTNAGGGLVQVMSDGSIIIRAINGKIFIHGGEVNIKSETDVNIETKQSFNVLAGTAVAMTAGTIPLPPDIPLPRREVPVLPGLPDPQATLDREISVSAAVAKAAELIDPTPSIGGHLQLDVSGATLNGPFVNLAPTTPTYQAKRASHLAWELSDYDLDPNNR